MYQILCISGNSNAMKYVMACSQYDSMFAMPGGKMDLHIRTDSSYVLVLAVYLHCDYDDVDHLLCTLKSYRAEILTNFA